LFSNYALRNKGKLQYLKRVASARISALPTPTFLIDVMSLDPTAPPTQDVPGEDKPGCCHLACGCLRGPLNSRLNFLRCIHCLLFQQTPYLGVHRTGSSSCRLENCLLALGSPGSDRVNSSQSLFAAGESRLPGFGKSDVPGRAQAHFSQPAIQPVPKNPGFGAAATDL
jgi:hypothetical protein